MTSGRAVAADNASNTDLPLDREREVVRRARTDPDAFADLYRHYLPRVHAYAWRRTGSQAAAEDITSATFESALANLDRFQWRRSGFAPWLFRIASNEVVAHYRREGRSQSDRGQRAMAMLADDHHIDDHHIDGLQDLGNEGERVIQTLNALNERYATALELRYLTGLDHGEAAAAMDLARPAFAVVLSRAHKAYRKAAAEIGADDA